MNTVMNSFPTLLESPLPISDADDGGGLYRNTYLDHGSHGSYLLVGGGVLVLWMGSSIQGRRKVSAGTPALWGSRVSDMLGCTGHREQ